MPQDKSLQMNQTIETAILQLQQSPTPEQLAHTLTVVRRCMQTGGPRFPVRRALRQTACQCLQGRSISLYQGFSSAPQTR